MKVNVLMSSYNGEKFINEQIDSIISQKSSCDICLFVRDDGSSDNTQAILERYQNKDLLKWYTGENLGPARSFIDLVYSSTKADYYAFADQDDIWNLDKIQRAVDVIEKEGSATPTLYFSNARLLIENKVSGLSVYKNIQCNLDLSSISCCGGALGCTMVFNDALRKIIVSHNKPQNLFMHDFYIFELCSAIKGKIIYDHNENMYYRQHSSNVIGVKRDFLSTIKNRIKDIKTLQKCGISEQARDILNTYYDILDDSSKDWLNLVSNYKRSLLTRILLAVNLRFRCPSMTLSFKIRIAILLGNR